jgi:sulfite oxidase
MQSEGPEPREEDMKVIENVKRRHFLIGSAGTMAAVAVGAPALAQSGGEPLPDYVAWKDAEDMIVHSKQTLETKRAAQGSELITPTTELYIRNNLPAPRTRSLPIAMPGRSRSTVLQTPAR